MAKLSNINDLFSVDSTGAIEFSTQVGTTGYVLESRGAGNAPVWTDRDTGNVIGTGTENKVVRWNAAPATGASQTIGDGPITFSSSGADANATFAGTVDINGSGNNSIAGDLYFGVNADIFKSSGTLGINADNSTFSGNVTVSGTSSSLNTGNSGTFVTNDANNYPRISTSQANIQLGLFRTTTGVGGVYIGGSSGGFELRKGSDLAPIFNVNQDGLTTIKRTGITGVATADMTLQIGYEGNNGQNNLIGFGYNGQTNIPAYIGYTTTSGSGSTKGDLIFATRDVTTDTAPTERMRILASGDIRFSANSHTPYIQLVNSGRTAANPGFTFNNDTNTGMFQPAGVADTIAFSTSGTERMRLGSGNQTMKLTAATTTGTNYIQFVNSSDTAQGYLGFGASGNNNLFISQESASSNIIFLNGGSERMRIQSDGNVLIGTTGATNTRLKVVQNAASEWACQITNTATSAYGLAVDTSANTGVFSLGVYTNTGTGMFVRNEGKVGIGTVSPSSKLDISDPVDRVMNANGEGQFEITGNGYTFGIAMGDTTTALYHNSSARSLTLGTDEAPRLTILGGGNVIIGNTAVDNPNSLTKVLEIENGGTVGVILNDSRDTPMGLENRGAVFHLTHNTNSILVAEGASGNVGIGDTSAPNRLSVKDTGNLVCRFTGGSTFSLIQNNTDGTVIFSANHGGGGSENRFIWQTNAGTAKMKLDSGTLTVSADVVAYGSPSDKRLKENIKPIESALDKVSKLNGVTFDWKKSNSILDIKKDIGFIAQDVQKVIPELVRENEDGMLSMRHQGIAPILLEAIKELKAEIEELKSNKCNCNK